MNKIISIIIPVYKVEDYLDQCLKSVVNQTHNDLEIILVDDGSPDKCPEICDRWQKQDARIKVIHKRNGGLSDARNAGLKIASGDYVGFVDSDDYVSYDMYEKLLEALEQDQSDIAACAVKKVYSDGRESWFAQHDKCVLTRDEAQKELLLERKLLNPVWYKLYRRSAINGIFFETGRQHEDAYWSYQAVGNAQKVSIIPDAGYYYRQRTDSIMGNGYTVKNLDVIEAVEKRQEYLVSNFPKLTDAGLLSIWNHCIFQGQSTLLYLHGAERKDSMRRLEECVKRHSIKYSQYSGLNWKNRAWITLARMSFPLTCRIRSFLKIGF